MADAERCDEVLIPNTRTSIHARAPVVVSVTVLKDGLNGRGCHSLLLQRLHMHECVRHRIIVRDTVETLNGGALRGLGLRLLSLTVRHLHTPSARCCFGALLPRNQLTAISSSSVM